MIVNLLIIFFTILLLYQLYLYLYPTREGIDDSMCTSNQLIDNDRRITALEVQLSNFNVDEIEDTIQDICNNVMLLNEKSDAQLNDLQSQVDNANTTDYTLPGPDDFQDENPEDDFNNINIDMLIYHKIERKKYLFFYFFLIYFRFLLK